MSTRNPTGELLSVGIPTFTRAQYLKDREPGEALQAMVRGIDAIVGGDSHTFLYKPAVVPDPGDPRAVSAYGVRGSPHSSPLHRA